MPIAGGFFAAFGVSLLIDIVALQDIPDTTLLMCVTAIQITIFALLADMIDKRTTRF